MIQGIHDLVVHDYGPGRQMISLHAEVPGDQNILIPVNRITSIAANTTDVATESDKESIAVFIVSMAILLMGLELFKSSFLKIIYPEPVDTSILAMGILAVSIAVKFYMAFYNHRVGKKIDSAAMKATAMDSL